MLLLALVACVAGCGARLHPTTTPEAVDEAVALLATWVAMVGVADPAASDELYAPDFRFAEVSPAGAARQTLDRTSQIRVCGDPGLWAVEGGFDVVIQVQVLGTDRAVRSGRRLLEMRETEGRLRVAADTFEVHGEVRLSTLDGLRWRTMHCAVHRPSSWGCVVFSVEGEPVRRIPYPDLWQAPENGRLTAP